MRVCVFIVSCDAHTIDLSSCISVTQSHDICPPCEQSVFFSHHAALCCGIHISCVVACTFLDVACTFLVLWRAHFFSPIMQRCVVACTFRSPVQACTSLFCLHHPVVHVMITPLGSKSVIFVSITHCCGLPHEEQNAFFGSMTALWYAP